jgi:hypothetical protein
MERQVEQALVVNSSALNVPRMNQILSSQIEVLTQVLAEIRNEIHR